MEFPTLIAAIVLLLVGREEGDKRVARGPWPRAFSRHLLWRLPLPCCSETEAFLSEAGVNAAERSCFMEIAVGTSGRLAVGLEVGLARGCVPGAHLRETLGRAAHSLFIQGFPH